MAQSPNPPDQTSPLLDLPGELRNRIYRAALLEDHIDVENACFAEPGLLRTCKMIRHETGPIFYAENMFEIEVRDYDSAAIVKWTKKEKRVAKEFKVEEMSARVSRGPQTPHWKNLVTAADRLAKGEIKLYLHLPCPSINLNDWSEKGLIRRVIYTKTAPPTFACLSSDLDWDFMRDLSVSGLHILLILENPLWKWNEPDEH